MEKKLSKYETLFVVDLSLGDEGVQSVIEKFKTMISGVGTIVQTSEWGKRRLAYPINDMTEGYYVLITFDAPTDFPAELNRVFNITEGVLRSTVAKAVPSTAKPMEDKPAETVVVTNAEEPEAEVVPTDSENAEVTADAEEAAEETAE